MRCHECPLFHFQYLMRLPGHFFEPLFNQKMIKCPRFVESFGGLSGLFSDLIYCSLSPFSTKKMNKCPRFVKSFGGFSGFFSDLIY